MKYVIFFDGGSIPNPGEGYGSFEIRDNKNNIVDNQLKIGFGPDLTCNQSEYLSLITALKSLVDNKTIDIKNIDLVIYSDSQLVVKQVLSKWKCKKYTLRQLLRDSKDLLKQFKSFNIKWYGRDNNVDRFGH